MNLTFSALRSVNSTRCLRWHKTGLNEWSLNDWIVAVGGEVGEALNVVKKLNRDREGQPGNKKTRAELLLDLGDELADAVIYLDTVLTSQREGQLGLLWGWEDFDGARLSTVIELAESERFLRSSDYGAGLLAASGNLARTATETIEELGYAADELLKAVDAVAWHFRIDLAAAIIRKFNATSERYGFPERLTDRVLS